MVLELFFLYNYTILYFLYFLSKSNKSVFCGMYVEPVLSPTRPISFRLRIACHACGLPRSALSLPLSSFLLHLLVHISSRADDLSLCRLLNNLVEEPAISPGVSCKDLTGTRLGLFGLTEELAITVGKMRSKFSRCAHRTCTYIQLCERVNIDISAKEVRITEWLSSDTQAITQNSHIEYAHFFCNMCSEPFYRFVWLYIR